MPCSSSTKKIECSSQYFPCRILLFLDIPNDEAFSNSQSCCACTGIDVVIPTLDTSKRKFKGVRGRQRAVRKKMVSFNEENRANGGVAKRSSLFKGWVRLQARLTAKPSLPRGTFLLYSSQASRCSGYPVFPASCQFNWYPQGSGVSLPTPLPVNWRLWQE